ncbi:hypothetical protein PhaeoP18_00713 [Phaeobacter piscinae]|uniref:Uncharacterized protein n=1 Tax=Phaeobacter piscinae TaxID=1580596 RepID=A0AAN1L9S2_9RHOB|nr:hypothetical protein PhaeoP13_00729 [Phaeobacter piscinae]AUR35006.1 hypothetical protein PhaeoP18_00713 [Phaeobacter piscinae]
MVSLRVRRSAFCHPNLQVSSEAWINNLGQAKVAGLNGAVYTLLERAKLDNAKVSLQGLAACQSAGRRIISHHETEELMQALPPIFV